MYTVSQQRLQAIDREQALLFVRIFMAGSLAFLVLWQTSLYIDALWENRQRRVAMAEATWHARDLLGSELQTFGADLKILAAGAAVQRLARGDASARAQAEADFTAFVREKPATAQLRYLDRDGQEVVRVVRNGEAIVRATGDALQNKSTRYYFTESIGLPEGRIYVSRIDLNVEHGAVEIPWRQMLRLAITIRGGGGEAAGIVILNIDVADFFADLQRSRPLDSAPLQLVNAEGYWLAGVPSDQLFGFMFNRETTMAARAPQAWQEIHAQRSGSVRQGSDIYIFDTLSPSDVMDAERAAPGGATRSDEGAELLWKIVGVVPSVSLASTWRLERLPVVLVALLVVAAISLAWSNAAMARRRSEDVRKRTEAELVRVERLASLGGLVAGISHELNTPIGNAVAVASTLSDEAAGFDQGLESGRISRSGLEGLMGQLRDGTALMLRDLRRAADLIGNFKQIAVDQTSERRRRFRMSSLVHDVVGTLQPRFKSSLVILDTRIDSQLELDSYAGALSQVLINLVQNALVHGFEEGQTGRIILAVRDLSSSEVEVVVEDSGKGIPRDLQDRIFEPFFTTRLGKGGSGLGLSIVFNIVTSILGGTIAVESRPDVGTRMVLRLPASAPGGASGEFRRIYDV
ncbi:MAG: sensor histidine kinase [Kiloniellaceae bacterium]